VDDLIDGMLRTMDTPGEFTGPVNLGNPSEFTMLELAEQVLSIVGGPSRLCFKPLPQDDPRQRQPNIALAAKELGWTPKVELKDDLCETVAYFRRILKL
jgi:UDP-glucuronate decarboxylase